ncbi:cob(I)yrinic acid a,c-diamide adenosyltransferase [Amycolatopsis cihanbeyliensis]|uniref:Corrinoid adenosyltransferase n=1 Tax=Amycolatopsis cihanbeyliensis TaxID=1128664 RepID=A0A542DQE7_AMYCI|nr:cob(I)yrinic acid a,c-diamide adenosyltransferase [Amycolatopsis cihanbeyliensis]TQJ05329.1 cob(I)alamin adenosyltransferase [Amycolatopsis cihanbeyliensis]
MKIYTRKGDSGETGIWGGKRLGKDEARMEAIGTVDEVNAAIGVAVAHGVPDGVAELLQTAQNTLFVVGCELMAPERTGSGASVPRLTGNEVPEMEAAIDELDQRLPELRNFILPSGTVAAAQIHLARGVCRRAERSVATVRRAEEVGTEVSAYLNRLADLLFVLARYVNHDAGITEIPWAPRG